MVLNPSLPIFKDKVSMPGSICRPSRKENIKHKLVPHNYILKIFKVVLMSNYD